MRKKIIAGNWKMNMLPNEAISCVAAEELFIPAKFTKVIGST